MSTKMYDLYRVQGKDIYQLWAWLVDLRMQYHTFLKEQIKPVIERHGRSMAIDVMTEATRSGMRSPFNIEASAVIYLHHEHLYLQFFGLPSRLYEDAPFLVDFHYQNQSDQPDDIPDEEWQERRRIVNALLDVDPIARPSHCGLAFLFADVDDIFGIV